MLELDDDVVARGFEPLLVPVRALDALHLASMEYLRQLGIAVELASYDSRLIAAARGMGFEIAALLGGKSGYFAEWSDWSASSPSLGMTPRESPWKAAMP